MEVDGKEFLRNVALEQDKERLIKEQQKLEEMKRESIYRDETYTQQQATPKQPEQTPYMDISMENNNPSTNQSNTPLEENQIQDLMLEPEDPNKTKKKYIILGMGLIVVFIITILVIRLISNNDMKEKMENLNPETKPLATDKILDKIDTNEEYQKVIDKKAASQEISKLDQAKKDSLNEIAISDQKVEDTPLVIDKPKPKAEPKRDLFGLDKNQQAKTIQTPPKAVKPPKVEPKKVVAIQKPAPKPQKKVVISPPVEKKLVTPKASKVNGYYIQIGAFTKTPSKGLLNTISKKGYNYAVHKMTIKGKLYNKVLIGPYPTRSVALKDLPKVRKNMNNPSAYILKF